MRLCSITWQTCMYLRAWQHQMTTVMQSCSHSNAILQPQIQETHRTTHIGHNHSLQNTGEEPITVGTTAAAPAPHAAHRRYLSSLAAATLRRKNARFRAPASSPTQAPCNIHAAITIRFAASRSKPAPIYAHGNARWQQSYSHYRSVLLCDVKSHTTVAHHPSLSVLVCDSLTPPFIECIVMWCQGSHHSPTPPFIECIVIWCQVSHHSLTPPFIECILMWCQVSPPFIECIVAGKSHP